MRGPPPPAPRTLGPLPPRRLRPAGGLTRRGAGYAEAAKARKRVRLVLGGQVLYHLAYLTWQTMPLLEKREVAPLAFLVPPAGVLVVGVGHFAVGTGTKATKKGFLALYKTLSYTMAAVALAYAAYVALLDGAARMSYPASLAGYVADGLDIDRAAALKVCEAFDTFMEVLGVVWQLGAGYQAGRLLALITRKKDS